MKANLSSDIESETDSALGFNPFWMTDLLADGRNVGIYSLRGHVQRGIPDSLEQFGATKHCAWILSQRA
jgi:hypothetical protein